VGTEAFAWGDLAITLAVMAPNAVAVPVMLCGTAEQQAQLLPRFADAAAPPLTAAIIEPLVKYNPYKLQTTAVLDGEEYLLDGAKTAVPFAEGAELFLVYAAEAGETQAFLVPAGLAGLTVGQRNKLMGIKALPTYDLLLESVRVPAANKLGGAKGIDFPLILAHSRVAMGAAAVGVARAAYEYALDYAKQRVQFGEPIAHRQSIAFMLADMATDVDEARLMVWEAAWKLDQDQDAVHDATVLKHHIDRLVLNVADRAVQILGGYGYIREYPVELWLRNARSFASLDGLAII
jgi:alkylation response protein AidB-like acyl-CoA dehydrogenase